MVQKSHQSQCIGDISNTDYSLISHDLLSVFSKRWHKETTSVHLPDGEMKVTLDDVCRPLHMPIQGRLLDHDKKLTRIERSRWQWNFIGADSEDIDREVHGTNVAHAWFNFLAHKFRRCLQEAQEGHVVQT
jgi:hypothetical protein